MRTIFDQADADTVTVQFDRVVAALGEKFGDAAEHLDEARADLLAFTGYPREIWRQIWSNNPMVILSQQDDQACELLLCVVNSVVDVAVHGIRTGAETRGLGVSRVVGRSA